MTSRQLWAASLSTAAAFTQVRTFFWLHLFGRGLPLIPPFILAVWSAMGLKKGMLTHAHAFTYTRVVSACGIASACEYTIVCVWRYCI